MQVFFENVTAPFRFVYLKREITDDDRQKTACSFNMQDEKRNNNKELFNQKIKAIKHSLITYSPLRPAHRSIYQRIHLRFLLYRSKILIHLYCKRIRRQVDKFRVEESVGNVIHFKINRLRKGISKYRVSFATLFNKTPNFCHNPL